MISARLPVALVVALALAACVDATAPEDFGPRLEMSVVGPQGVSDAERAALGDAFDRVDRYDVSIRDAGTLDLLAEATVSIDPGLEQHVLDIPVPEAAFGRSVVILLVAFGGGTELYRSVAETTLSEDVGVVSVNLQIRYTGPGIRGTVRDASGAGVGGVSVNLMEGPAIVDAVATEADGTYLFVDVPLGAYQVSPTLPVGVPYLCPGTRDVSIESTDDALVADFATSDDVCGTSVLVLSGGDLDDTGVVQALLETNPSLSVSTFFLVNAPPGLGTLSEYDVVLLFSNGLFDQSVALGSQVRDYVANGGNVVIASFYWQGRGDSGLGSSGWGTLEGVDPFFSDGGATYEAADLAGIVPHPLTSGIATLNSDSGFHGGVTPRAETTVLATWSDGAPLIGYRVLGAGQRIVGVSLFPAAGATVTGDVQALWENAVVWAGAAGGPAPN
ncbi:MAG: carboxypeptidase regulatory-like domain-containing protein [Gemmatimonadota bacterium]|nr:carboxypeptidase regulatory-like domain-containing protein [Gemmatimonadota bacterium]MDH3424362.1 carboxypeptidase regulatory-like domain-containing protein [Gemmatimonadota bacterium]